MIKKIKNKFVDIQISVPKILYVFVENTLCQPLIKEESLNTNFVRNILKVCIFHNFYDANKSYFFAFIMCIYVSDRTCYAAEGNTYYQNSPF